MFKTLFDIYIKLVKIAYNIVVNVFLKLYHVFGDLLVRIVHAICQYCSILFVIYCWNRFQNCIESSSKLCKIFVNKSQYCSIFCSMSAPLRYTRYLAGGQPSRKTKVPTMLCWHLFAWLGEDDTAAEFRVYYCPMTTWGDDNIDKSRLGNSRCGHRCRISSVWKYPWEHWDWWQVSLWTPLQTFRQILSKSVGTPAALSVGIPALSDGKSC